MSDADRTPIPRTLNHGHVGHGASWSIIATPPARGRPPCFHKCVPSSAARLRRPRCIKGSASCVSDLRGGQVYYLHNEFSTIEKCRR